MALADKNIVITPNVGQTSDPKIVFSGADSVLGPQNITLQVYPTSNGTLSFEGSSGQLFSITNSLSGSIFSVNDVSGIPSIEVLDTGTVKIAQYGGNVGIGTGDVAFALGGGVVLYNNTSPRIELKSPTTGTTINDGAGIAEYLGDMFVFNKETGKSVVLITESTERVRIDSAGNVGIGVTPSVWSTVRKTIQLGLGGLLSASTGSSTFLELGTNNYVDTSNAYRYINSGLAANYRQLSGAHSWFTAPSGTAGATSTLTQVMTLTNAGSLGVGTTAPNARLELAVVSAPGGASFFGGADNLRLLAASGSAFGEPAVKFQEAGTDVGAAIAGKNTANGAMAIVFANRPTSSTTSALTEKMRIAQDGNVGIGTQSPLARLHVAGTIIGQASDNYFGNYSSGAYIDIGNLATSEIYFDSRSDSLSNVPINLRTKGSGEIKFVIGSTEGARIDSTGVRLVSNSTRIAQTSTAAWSGDAGTGFGKLEYHSNRWYINAGSDSTEVIRIRRGATDLAFVENNGHFNAPSFKISDDSLNRFQNGALILRSTSPTVYFRDTDSNSAMLHCNSNLLYILRGANDTESWTQVSGQWPFYINLTNNIAQFGAGVNAVGDVTAYSSDRRLKENFRPIENSLEKLLMLSGMYFDWKDEIDTLGFTPTFKKDDAGLIAQDVQAILPQAVAPAPFDRVWNNDKLCYESKSGKDYLTVKYEKLVPLLVEAIKELDAKYENIIETLMQKVESLEAKINGKQ